MPKIEIPSTLRNFFKKVGIDDLPKILQVLGSVRGVVVINVPVSAVPVFQGGKLEDHSVVKGTAAGSGKGNFSESEAEHRMTVPVGKRWLVFATTMYPDVSATVQTTIFNAAAKELAHLGEIAAATAVASWPDYGPQTYVGAGAFPLPLKAGDYIRFLFGANQAATAYCTAIISEIDV